MKIILASCKESGAKEHRTRKDSFKNRRSENATRKTQAHNEMHSETGHKTFSKEIKEACMSASSSRLPPPLDFPTVWHDLTNTRYYMLCSVHIREHGCVTFTIPCEAEYLESLAMWSR